MVTQGETTQTAAAAAVGRGGRRGILAAAAGVVAALAAKVVTDAEPVAADDQTWNLPYSGIISSAATLASFVNTGVGGGVFGSSNSSYGVYGATYAATGSGFAGVYGAGSGTGSYGVVGITSAATGSGYAGVFGQANGTGTYGVSGSNADGFSPGTGTGVLGTSSGAGNAILARNTGTGIGLYATANANYAVFASSVGATTVFGNLLGGVAGTAGVHGDGNGPGTYGAYGTNIGGGAAVYGLSTSGIGVYGNSTGGSAAGAQPYGVVGTVTGAPGFALYGVSTVAGTVAFAGGTTVVGGIAGQLSGPVNILTTGPGIPGNLYVQGNQTASGTKSAAVPHPDGSHRLLYCVESPEAWFEDFGRGTLAGGKVDIRLDPDFAAVVDTRVLHVFLTPHDAAHHLAVTTHRADGFAVTASVSAEAAARGVKATDLGGTFTYRVVAKRKDVAAPRLAKFAVPQEIKVPALVIPPTPAPMAKPAPAPVVVPPMPPMLPLPPNSGKGGGQKG